jgi:hypothetical protein
MQELCEIDYAAGHDEIDYTYAHKLIEAGDFTIP